MGFILKTDPILASLAEAAMPTGEKIQALRTMKGWSQDELAEKLGTKGPNVSRWENNHGTPSADTLRDLARIFDVSVDYLLFEEAPLRPLLGFKDSELVEQFTEVDQLEESARVALKRIIKALTAEKRVREAVGRSQ